MCRGDLLKSIWVDALSQLQISFFLNFRETTEFWFRNKNCFTGRQRMQKVCLKLHELSTIFNMESIVYVNSCFGWGNNHPRVFFDTLHAVTGLDHARSVCKLEVDFAHEKQGLFWGFTGDVPHFNARLSELRDGGLIEF